MKLFSQNLLKNLFFFLYNYSQTQGNNGLLFENYHVYDASFLLTDEEFMEMKKKLIIVNFRIFLGGKYQSEIFKNCNPFDEIQDIVKRNNRVI